MLWVAMRLLGSIACRKVCRNTAELRKVYFCLSEDCRLQVSRALILMCVSSDAVIRPLLCAPLHAQATPPFFPSLSQGRRLAEEVDTGYASRGGRELSYHKKTLVCSAHFQDNSGVLQHVILAKKPYERRLRGAAPVLYVILVRKPHKIAPR